MTVNGLPVPTEVTPSNQETLEIAGAVFPTKVNRGLVAVNELKVVPPIHASVVATAPKIQAAVALSATIAIDELKAKTGSVVTVELIPPALLLE